LGARYEVAAEIQSSDVELPSATGQDIRLTDRDAILVRRGVKVTDPRAGLYAARAVYPFFGGAVLVPAPRAWTSVVAKVHGRSFLFFNTHLETEQVPPVQVAQGLEAIAILGAQPLPVIAVGDFNSAADGSTTPTYANLLAAGLRDAWPMARPRSEGLTCCQREDLRNPLSQLSSRIDLVLSRGVPGGVAAIRVGSQPFERTRSGLWPSDHEGVVAVVRVM
jgi:endonuclease/exonuclease/phosphatase family metal-dependent hydrolase